MLPASSLVYTKIIPDAASVMLMPIIKRKVWPDSIVYSDCWKGYVLAALKPGGSRLGFA